MHMVQSFSNLITIILNKIHIFLNIIEYILLIFELQNILYNTIYIEITMSCIFPF